ncbi:chlorohydrolase family protein [Vibrio sp.]|uniref:chlorohydrolase family protein n=1 Tax=Vibrio sp. TaxID=678 RepID=UPI003D14FD38
MITKLSGKWVVGYQEGGHCVYENGEVVYDDSGKVLFVGHQYSGHVDQHEDLGNVLIGPGFIDLDAIVDLDSTVLAFEHQPGWKKGRIPSTKWQRQETYNPEQLAFNKRYAFNMLLMNGITTVVPITSILYREWAETYDEFITAAEIAEQVGIRAYLGPAYMSGYASVNDDGSFLMHFDEHKGQQGLDDAIRFVDVVRQQYSSRIQGILAPDRIEGCTPILLKNTARAAESLNCPVRLHSCQGEFEVQQIDQLHDGITSIEYMHQAGLLSPRLLLPHLQLLGGLEPNEAKIESDLQKIAESGAHAVVCPLVAGRHAKYFNGVSNFQRRGINIALGTDTFPVDIIQNMHIGTILSRVSQGNITEASALDYYNMATLGGARALNRPDLGRLCPGSAADIMVFDFDSIYTGQNFDPITTMIINGSGREVTGVIVDGVKRVWNNECLNESMDDLHQQAQAQFDYFITTYPERCYGNQAVEDIFPSVLPIIKNP